MNVQPDLSLDFADPVAAARVHELRLWRGFSAERVTLEGSDGFAYRRAGSCHYLALHDIRLEDGEIAADGVEPDQSRDLRNLISFFPTGCEVAGWSVPSRRHNSFTALYFEPALLGDELQARFAATAPRPFVYVRDARLRATLEKLRDQLSPAAPRDDLYAEHLCLVAALEALAVTDAPASGQLSRRTLARITDYLDDHLDARISLSDLAAIAGLSRFHFSRAFKAATGVSPYQFVIDMRVERAAQLLRGGAASIEEVSSAVGFGSSASLRRAFIGRLGMSPQAWRRQS